MSEATKRALRHNEGITVARDGRTAAQLEPAGGTSLSTAALVDRFSKLPPIDPEKLRADIDAVIDQTL